MFTTTTQDTTQTAGTTVWSEPNATMGWFKAICKPWSNKDRYGYTNETMPVWDSEIGAWREQSTLGNYTQYDRPMDNGRSVLAVCYASARCE
jgi:hypothetical protein